MEEKTFPPMRVARGERCEGGENLGKASVSPWWPHGSQQNGSTDQGGGRGGGGRQLARPGGVSLGRG